MYINLYLKGTVLKAANSFVSHAFLQKKKRIPGPGYSKQATYLVKVSLKFQTLISGIRQYFLLKNCETSLIFLNKKYQCICVYILKTLNELTS